MSCCRASIKIYNQSRCSQAKVCQAKVSCKPDDCSREIARNSVDVCSTSEKNPSPEKCDFKNEDTPVCEECMPEEYRAGNARRRRAKWRLFCSKATSIYLPKGDVGAQPANNKKTGANKLILKLYKLIDELFEALKRCPCKIDKCDFENCPKLVCKVKEIHKTMTDISQALAYSPYIHEMTELNDQLSKIIDYINEIPALIYVRLVDITFCVHEFGSLLQEVFLPIDFALAIQKIQTHLRVRRQYRLTGTDF